MFFSVKGVSVAEEWPFEEARRIIQYAGGMDRPIILETGFGPSGLPHIGTFGEVVRTSFLMVALKKLGATDVRCYVYSDDMDGLRKVPQNMPEWLSEHLGKPLNEIPDPQGCCPSYSLHMNRLLVSMVGRMTWRYRQYFGGDPALHPDEIDRRLAEEVKKPEPRYDSIPLGPYHFYSSTTQYRGGRFNEALGLMLKKVDLIKGIIAPTLSADKREAWSPFFPICKNCRRIYSTRVIAVHPERAALTYACDEAVGAKPGCGVQEEISVHDGRVKVGWKVDWALRWYVLGITYEMFGKDLIESAALSGKIVRALEGRPPLDYFYELFLDETGAKISKSVGKGVTVETWLELAPFEALALFMYRNPRRAKRLFFGVIPQFVDEFLKESESFYQKKAAGEDVDRSLYTFLDPIPAPAYPLPAELTYGTLINMVGTIGSRDLKVIRSYLERHFTIPEHGKEMLDTLIEQAARFYDRIILPTRQKYTPSDAERQAIGALAEYLAAEHPGDEIQAKIFDVARAHAIEPKDFFKALYSLLTGMERGPRLGSFIKLLGEGSVRQKLLEGLA